MTQKSDNQVIGRVGLFVGLYKHDKHDPPHPSSPNRTYFACPVATHEDKATILALCYLELKLNVGARFRVDGAE